VGCRLINGGVLWAGNHPPIEGGEKGGSIWEERGKTLKKNITSYSGVVTGKVEALNVTKQDIIPI